VIAKVLKSLQDTGPVINAFNQVLLILQDLGLGLTSFTIAENAINIKTFHIYLYTVHVYNILSCITLHVPAGLGGYYMYLQPKSPRVHEFILQSMQKHTICVHVPLIFCKFLTSCFHDLTMK
jgi:hypothetical protein